MPLSWDITEIENGRKLCWLENPDPQAPEDEKYVLNPVTEALVHLSMFTGISVISKKNWKELSIRLMELELLNIAILQNENGTDKYRNPREEEVKLHIGLVTNVPRKDTRKWKTEVSRILRERARETMTKLEVAHESSGTPD